MAATIAAIEAILSRVDLSIIREMCLWVTWAIS
jgi:hypothetical protein